MNSSKTDYCFREKRLKPFLKHQFPRFIECKPLRRMNAHVSMYGVSAEVANLIMKAGTVRGFMPAHYNPFVWVDVDAMSSSMKVKQTCIELDLHFLMFLSGNKGAHFAILREANPASDLYLRDKMLVMQLFAGTPGASDIDYSLYNKPLHLIRAVGCKHDKTGKKKELYYQRKGSNIPSVVDMEVGALNRQIHFECDAHETPTWNSLQRVVLMHSGPISSRYMAMWQMAKDLFKSGFETRIVKKMLEVYNEHFEEPHTESEVDRAITDANRAVFGVTTISGSRQ